MDKLALLGVKSMAAVIWQCFRLFSKRTHKVRVTAWSPYDRADLQSLAGCQTGFFKKDASKTCLCRQA